VVVTDTGREDIMKNTEIIFVVHEADDGGFWAKCLSHDIFTQADTWEELKENVKDAISCSFNGEDCPSIVRLHFTRDEVFAL
jgi:predicted RNase H-like HicB family nuclease